MEDFGVVSLIVTTKNEEENIGRCLDSLRAQTYPNIEIILVDNNSRDKTKEIAKNKGAKVYNFGPERSAQRNYGIITKSQGKFVMYVDADMILTPNLIMDCVNDLSAKPGVIALYIPEMILGKSLFCRIRRFERQFYDGTSIDSCRFFRREAFIQSGGFDEELFKKGGCEDWDLDKKIRNCGEVAILQQDKFDNKILNDTWIHKYAIERGVRIGNRSFILHDESEDRLVQYLEKKRYYAPGFSGYILKWGASDSDVQKQFSIYYRLFKVFFEKSKWRIVLKNPLFYLLTLGLRILVGLWTLGKWNSQRGLNLP
jgi:glycosyltransferase involved in cell wall biosynthesis